MLMFLGFFSKVSSKELENNAAITKKRKVSKSSHLRKMFPANFLTQ